jgi:hypothetical protein|tara:strand:- start:25 stop:993 length:969 start_codon:yes stop_codon:yes gene_type:complete
MPVPSSGQLRLRADINLEVEGNDTDDNVSLGTLSNTAGFTEPDTMSEFYGYVGAEPATFGSISFSNVSDTTMRATVTITNPSGLHLDFGFYHGTSTNRTSNTKYTVNDNTATSITYYRDFSSLSGSTTYRCWGWCTYRGGEFSETSSSMASQTTLAPITYSTYNGAYEWIYAGGYSGEHTQGWWGAAIQYDHPYHSWTTSASRQVNFYRSSSDVSNSATYQSSYKYRSGVTVPTRAYVYTYLYNLSGGNSEGSGRWNAPSSISGSNAYNKVTTSTSQGGSSNLWASNISTNNVYTMYGTQYGQYHHYGNGLHSGNRYAYFNV